MANVSLTVGFNPAPNTQALIDGSVRPKGIDLRVQTEFGHGLDNIGARHRAIIAGEIAGGEYRYLPSYWQGIAASGSRRCRYFYRTGFDYARCIAERMPLSSILPSSG